MVTRTARPDPPAATEKLEVELLLEGIVRRYGFDLREYDADFVVSRVRRFLQAEGLETVTQLLDRILRDSETLNSLLERLTESPPQIFSPVRFWRSLRRKVTPRLRTYPSIQRLFHPPARRSFRPHPEAHVHPLGTRENPGLLPPLGRVPEPALVFRVERGPSPFLALA